jgi:hypothetical protein
VLEMVQAHVALLSLRSMFRTHAHYHRVRENDILVLSSDCKTSLYHDILAEVMVLVLAWSVAYKVLLPAFDSLSFAIDGMGQVNVKIDYVIKRFLIVDDALLTCLNN